MDAGGLARRAGVTLRLRSRRIITPGGTIAGEIEVEAGRIAAVTRGPPRETAAVTSATAAFRTPPREPSSDELIDLGDRWLAPGFIDTHVHGGAGAQCTTSDPGEVADVGALPCAPRHDGPAGHDGERRCAISRRRLPPSGPA